MEAFRDTQASDDVWRTASGLSSWSVKTRSSSPAYLTNIS